ncbi:MAG: hypothetical protein J6B31_08680 [Bacteroidaceae bacterium]|nr:hypothetical protein [Bacteroidaceae bacterium]
MKKKMLVVAGLMMSMVATAQNAYDAQIALGSELNGTARFIGMGGAMGALGGDISVMGTNPAGIGIYRRNDFSISFGANNTATESAFKGSSMKEDRTKASFDQVGFVYSYKVGNETSLRYVNFGFNYHKSMNFNRLFSMGGMLDGLSQSWQLAQEMDNAGMNETVYDEIWNAAEYNINPYQKYWNQYPVLGIMGTDMGVVDFYDGALGWPGYSNRFYSEEKGGISQYDFNVAFNIEDRVYVGATLGVYDLKYDRYSSYSEELDNDNGEENGNYSLENYYRLEGTGVDLKLGVIVRPFEESPFRVGLAIHTPTWYDLSESYNATMSSDIYAYDDAYTTTLSDNFDPTYTIYDYRMQTPWKFNINAGTTFAGLVALGAEYEYQDYSSAKLEDVEGYELGGQSSVEANLKGVHTFRVGMEARLAPQVSLRAGYNYSSAMFNKDAYNALEVYRTNTDFNNIQERNTLTCGLGYRGNVIYADLAYKYDMYKSEFYAFDDINLPKTNVDNTRHQLVFTLGAQF